MGQDRWGSGPANPTPGPGDAWGNPAGEILTGPPVRRPSSHEPVGRFAQPILGRPRSPEPDDESGTGLGHGSGWLAGSAAAGNRRSRSRTAATVAAALAVAGLAGGGTFAYSALSGGGDQPEQHVPASAVAFAKIDLDPDASQKVDAIRFLMKLPDSRQRPDSDADLRHWAYQRTLAGVPGAPGWSQVRPWLGNRAGVAWLPADPPSKGRLLVVLQVSDDQLAERALSSLPHHTVAVSDGWALIADGALDAQALADQAAAHPLSGAAGFAADQRRLGQDGIAELWLDGPGLGRMAQVPSPRPEIATALGWHGAMTLRFDGPRLELAGDFSGTGASIPPAAGGTGVSTLPGSTVAAVGARELGPALARSWSQLDALASSAGRGRLDPAALLSSSAGLRPTDLVALFGDRFALAVGGRAPDGAPSVGARGHSATAGPVLDKLAAVFAGAGRRTQRRQAGGDWVMANTSVQADALAATGDLGSTERFRAVLPDASEADLVAYADLGRLMDAYAGEVDADQAVFLRALGAVGFSERRTAGGVRFAVRVGAG